MADEDLVTTNENQDQDQFNLGFSGDVTPPVTVTPAEPVAPVVEPTPAPAAEVKPEVKPDTPKYVQITQEQFDQFQAAASRTDGWEKRMKDTVVGTVGNMEQRIVEKLQAATPQGVNVELPPDVVSEMEEEFPEIATVLKKSLEKAFKGIKGTAPTGNVQPSIEPEVVQKLVQDIALKHETEALEDTHPNWREVVGMVDEQGNRPATEFRTWLAKQDDAYQARVNAANTASVVSRAIDKFLASKASSAQPSPTPSPKANARAAVIRAAVQPRGDGGQPAPSKNDDDAFNEGFRTG